MKRRGAKKAQKTDDDSNGVEDVVEKNGGGVSEVEEEENEQPKDKKRKSKANRKNAPKKTVEVEDPIAESDPLEDVEDLKKPKDKLKKSKADSEEEEEGDGEDETQYEVEKVNDDKMIAGIRHYLIRWKGYGQGDDTWEPEDTLNCPDKIKEYKDAKKKTKGAKEKVKKDEASDWDENEDFEVDRILEVHHKKNGKREFLVSWKGYAAKDNSWEPEENMNCKDLIQKFMEKVVKAKELDDRELRINRKRVQRLTYNTTEKNRRLSKRMSGKERVQYHDAE